ncbi:unnamed protein product [Durusdinium trenchii]|uniref:DUF382 domain-containing protein n=1 Tax=Durusdinium trenchii TaxID=1381693 RepID=A0ABP0J3N8_9DINO
MERFKYVEPTPKDEADEDEDKPQKRAKPKASLLEEAEDSDDDDQDAGKMSKKKRKVQNRMSVAELKTLVKRPDVVEVWDTTASDPRLLVYLKAYRNTVAVPRHWSSKRKYMAGKRGVEKPPFKLPDFIESTGIAKIRQAKRIVLLQGTSEICSRVFLVMLGAAAARPRRWAVWAARAPELRFSAARDWYTWYGDEDMAPTPVGGADTPGPVTMNLNPEQVETEGILTADIIRQQLKQHEEAAAKAKLAAGQKEVEQKKTVAKPAKKRKDQLSAQRKRGNDVRRS